MISAILWMALHIQPAIGPTNVCDMADARERGMELSTEAICASVTSWTLVGFTVDLRERRLLKRNKIGKPDDLKECAR